MSEWAKHNIQLMRDHLKFVYKTDIQPKFEFLAFDTQNELYWYIENKLNKMCEAESVSATEILDIFLYHHECFFDETPILDNLLRKVFQEKVFIDDILDVYDCVDNLDISPNRLQTRNILSYMHERNQYNPIFIYKILHHNIITKEELFSLAPGAEEALESNILYDYLTSDYEFEDPDLLAEGADKAEGEAPGEPDVEGAAYGSETTAKVVEQV